MEVIRDISKIRKLKNPVVALGVFDGVHCAHRVILKSAVSCARRIGGTSVVLTFHPHPQAQQSLYSLQHRLRLIEGLGVDVCVVLRFNRRFASITAHDFVSGVLARRVRASRVYIGNNFRFGRNAEGDPGLLRELSREYKFKVKVFDPIRIGKRPISSTYIRRLISEGNLREAEKFLCSAVTILGTVVKGASLGRRLGFPTANINPHHEVIPPPGVYAAQVLLGGKKMKGICYIGTRPTFEPKGDTRQNIEVHIFDFKGDLYGRDLEIRFVKKIRPQRRFGSPAVLVRQIKKDVESAQMILSCLRMVAEQSR